MKLLLDLALILLCAAMVFRKSAARAIYRLGAGLHTACSNTAAMLDLDTTIEEAERAADKAREQADQSEAKLAEAKRRAGVS